MYRFCHTSRAALAKAVMSRDGMSSRAGISRSENSQVVILVAEDNLTNQKVLGCQLEALGYRPRFAANGLEALAQWQAQGCTLLLTDCHMPELDGFELATAIRRYERGRAGRTPIIAITGSLEAEAANCLGAGMDACLSKPVGLDQLREVLGQWLPAHPLPDATCDPAGASDGRASRAAQDATAAPVNREAVSYPVMDPAALGRLLVSDDRDVLRPFMLEFVDCARATVGDLQAAHGHRNAAAIAALAHRLKSSAAAVGALALSHICQALEAAGRSGDWHRIDSLLDACAAQFHEVAAWIHADA
jgi:CheY-like chemotaxis protein/HPt (histidine-containing phosphotransfer) domain-containing protein